jgi:hypothetical protein
MTRLIVEVDTRGKNVKPTVIGFQQIGTTHRYQRVMNVNSNEFDEKGGIEYYKKMYEPFLKEYGTITVKEEEDENIGELARGLAKTVDPEVEKRLFTARGEVRKNLSKVMGISRARSRSRSRSRSRGAHAGVGARERSRSRSRSRNRTRTTRRRNNNHRMALNTDHRGRTATRSNAKGKTQHRRMVNMSNMEKLDKFKEIAQKIYNRNVEKAMTEMGSGSSSSIANAKTQARAKALGFYEKRVKNEGLNAKPTTKNHVAFNVKPQKAGPYIEENEL